MTAKRTFVAYATVPVYADFFRWLGRGDEIDPVVEAWNAGDRKRALELAPEALIRETFLLGPVEAQRERLAEFARRRNRHGGTRPGVPAGRAAGRDRRLRAPLGPARRGHSTSGLPISQRCPKGSTIRPSSQRCSSCTGDSSTAPRATACETTARGSSTTSKSLTVVPPSVSGLKLPWAGDSSATQKDASPTESCDTTSSCSAVPPTR